MPAASRSRPVTSAAPPRALTIAFWVVVAESGAEVAFVLSRDEFGFGARAALTVAFVAKVVFAHRARRLSAGGVLGLLVFELVGILVVLDADWALAPRLALLATVVCVFALVLSSLRAFPTPELPRP